MHFKRCLVYTYTDIQNSDVNDEVDIAHLPFYGMRNNWESQSHIDSDVILQPLTLRICDITYPVL